MICKTESSKTINNGDNLMIPLATKLMGTAIMAKVMIAIAITMMLIKVKQERRQKS